MLRRHTYVLTFSCGLSAALTGACETGKGTLDADGDGWEVGDDCDDSDPNVNPAVIEICGDGLDNDCFDGDQACYTDLDGDGWEVGDDCDDSNSYVHPGATEDCMSGLDDNCDGVNSQCVWPGLIYAPTSPAGADSYDAAVFANQVVFGDPGNGGVQPIGDGRALFFPPDAGMVTELDATLLSEGAGGEYGAYGTTVGLAGAYLCITADYQDHGATPDAGKSWCFSEASVLAASNTLPLTDASFTTAGELQATYAKVEAEVDVDGDGNLDLLVYTANDIQVILGTGAPWSGDYEVPSDADLSLGNCTSSTSGWCGFARALGGSGSSLLALSEESGTPDSISLYELPLVGGSTVPTASASVDRNVIDSATGVELIDGVAFGNSLSDEVTFLDSAGNTVGTIQGSGSEFGYWTSSFIDARGHELLLVSAPYEGTPESSGTGIVRVFDLSANGLPTDFEQAQYVLVPPETFFQCGGRARGGLVRDGNGTWTVIASACPSTGGAAYQLNYQLDPPPPVQAADIHSTEQGQYEIRQWVVDAYTSEIDWLMSLAQTESLVSGGNIVGWRLHAISPGSPLFRAGLRNNDVLKRVNGINVSSPQVVNQLFASLAGAQALTIGIIRNGTPRLLDYTIVP